MLPKLPCVTRLVAAFALLLAFALPAAAPAQAPAAQAKDWGKTVTAMPNGAFTVGNPNAKIHLVEYFAYTCPHCAEFAKESTKPLMDNWIKPGKLSIEYRNYVLSAVDVPVGLLVRCGGTSTFLANHEAVFSDYDTWIAQLQKWISANGDSLKGKKPDEIFPQIADAAGLTALIARNGQSSDALHKCLVDKEAVATIMELSASAWDADPNFEGTPGFIINGKPAKGVHTWASLKPLLDAALPAPTN